MTTTTRKDITPRQIEYLQSLLKVAIVPEDVSSPYNSFLVDFLVDAHSLERSAASELIDYLGKLPTSGKVDYVPANVGYPRSQRRFRSYQGSHGRLLGGLLDGMFGQTRNGGTATQDYRDSEGKVWQVTVVRRADRDR